LQTFRFLALTRPAGRDDADLKGISWSLAQTFKGSLPLTTLPE